MIMHSLLDNDLYKFTMQQAVLHQYPNAMVKYKFKCRTPFKFTPEQVKDINTEVRYLCSIIFNDQELWYLKTLPFLTDDYVQFLKNFKLDPKFIKINADSDCGLNIEIDGPWLHTILFEVPVLAIVSEISGEVINRNPPIKVMKDRLKVKMGKVRMNTGLKFADFGTRRRYSYDVQTLIIKTLKEECPQCIGTSNVFFAYNTGMTPIGTMAHEWLQAHQALGTRLIDSQKAALEAWVQEYRGSLGIALTDVIGIDAFLKDFDLYFAKLYAGVRHDSGDPYAFADKVIAHYQGFNIDPMSKTIVFSNSLDFDKIVELHNAYSPLIGISFGIGTNLMNDVGDGKPLNIVLKMTECNRQPVAKISDDEGKTMCEDADYVGYLKSVFGG